MTVVAAIIFFMVEVGLRTREYFKYNTNVDMELYFPERIPFPAVTICNQNAHKLTQAVELNLYSFLDEAYTTRNISGN